MRRYQNPGEARKLDPPRRRSGGRGKAACTPDFKQSSSRTATLAYHLRGTRALVLTIA
jgi:hypothetical protein